MRSAATDHAALMRQVTGEQRTMARTIKVWMQVSIEVDLDEMENEYGRAFNEREARADVRDSVSGILYQTLYPEGSGIVKDVKVTK